ncbi:MAG: lipid-A-disaccharide synthase [Pirellulaceae bacterium]|nr:lipid-A-disaccharide synthase [Pirellulaceae bacterium]
MKIFFSVGEPSGDLHGANLIRDLRERRPDLQAVGYGGPLMQAAGCDLHADLTELAVMWIGRVLSNLRTFRRLVLRAGQYMRRERPDAVVLIDYPGFNWWIARQARAEGIPVIYYGPPQMWAWAGWRVRKLRRLVDHVLCKLPFEAAWYAQRDCPAHYVGHPYFDQMQRQVLDAEFLRRLSDSPQPLVTILPGSRNQEVETQLPWFLRAARLVLDELPETRLAIASFNQRQAETARRLVAASGVPAEVHVGRTPELIQAARCCMACSGSVSLELLHHEKPTVILYYVSRLFYRVVWNLITVKYVTLVNLLAVEEPFGRSRVPYDPDAEGAPDLPFPEYPTYEDKSRQLADHVCRWLSDPAAHAAKVSQLRALKQRYGQPGASRRAAEYILAALNVAAVCGRADSRAARAA